MDKIDIVCGFLTENNIYFEKFSHKAVSSIDECRKIEEIIGSEICKNLLLRNTPGTAYYLLSMKGDKAFVTKNISKKLGVSRLSFVSAEEMQTLVDTSPGSLGIFSLLFDKDKKIRFAADRDLLENEFICFHAGINTCTLKIRTKDVFEKILPLMGVETEFIEV